MDKTIYYYDVIQERSLNMAKKRFVETYANGIQNAQRIIVDTETGVNYLMASSTTTMGCGMCVLVDKEGKPIITTTDTIEE